MNTGRFYAYVGWVLAGENADTDLDAAKDLSKYPELVWINKYHYVFPYTLLMVLFGIGEWTPLLGSSVNGLSAVAWGFFFSTFLSLQGSLLVNAFAHGTEPNWFAYRTYETNDTTTNNWLLSIVGLGAAWHNNHHRYMNAARAGFFWWEIDVTYLILRFLALLGIVWDIREVPEAVLIEGAERMRRARTSKVLG